MIRCKVRSCDKTFSSAFEHVAHNDVCHKVHFKSLIMCGFPDCGAEVSNIGKYRSHIINFYQENLSVSADQGDQSSNTSGDGPLYKCAHSGCDYTSRSKVTLRSHRFRKHSNTKDELVDQSGSENVATESVNATFLTDLEVGDVACNALNTNGLENEASLMPKCSGTTISVESLTKKFVHMALTLNSKKHVPDSTIHYVLDSYSILLREAAEITAEKLSHELAVLGISSEVAGAVVEKIIFNGTMNQLHGLQGPMRSYHMRKQQYKKYFPHVPPYQVSLGLNDHNIMCKYHYIPIAQSLKWLFEDDSVYEQYLESTKRTPVMSPDLEDIQSGTCFQNHPLFGHDRDALQIILYCDDVDVANCIGAASGSYKLMHVGYTLGNLNPWSRAKVDPLQVLMLCKEQDASYFGFTKVLSKIIEELKDIEENGIDIRGKNVKAGVLVLLGDNLGTHTIGGFSAGFSKSHYFCRYCEESREEWQARWYDRPTQNSAESSSDESNSDSDESEDTADEQEEDEVVELDSDDDALEELIPLSELRKRLNKNNAPLRTVSSYNECLKELEKNPNGVKGVVADSGLNKLKHYHVVGGTPPCIHHDIHEGFASYDLWYCIKYLSKKYKFSLAYLNRKIRLFPFQGTEKLDRPPPKFNAQRKKVKGNAVQMSVFLRFLPMLIGDKVTDKSDPVWVLILTLIEIVVLITSPFVSRSVLNYVDSLICKYLKLRTSSFKTIRLRPKHHFFEHYVMLLLMYGSLSRCSTLRFESKHKYFKSEIRNKKYLKNMTMSLAEAHQRMQSALKVDDLFKNAPLIKDAIPFSELKVDDGIMQCLLSSFGMQFASKLFFSQTITYHNVTYKEGDILVTSTRDHPQIELCKVKLLLSDGKTAYAIAAANMFEDDDSLIDGQLEQSTSSALAEGSLYNTSNQSNSFLKNPFPSALQTPSPLIPVAFKDVVPSSPLISTLPPSASGNIPSSPGLQTPIPVLSPNFPLSLVSQTASSIPSVSITSPLVTPTSQESRTSVITPVSCVTPSTSPIQRNDILNQRVSIPFSSVIPEPDLNPTLHSTSSPGNPESDVTVSPESATASVDLTASETSAKALVVEKLKKYIPADKENDLFNRLNELGVENISDLMFLNLEASFSSLMTAVKIGRLKKELEKDAAEASNTSQKSREVPLNFKDLFSKPFLEKLEGNKRLSKSDRLKLVREIGDEIFIKISPVTEKYCNKIAAALQNSYKEALSGSCQFQGGIDLGGQILAHVRYEMRKDRNKRKRPDLSDSSNLNNFSKRQNSGIPKDTDLPLQYPENEDKTSQEESKARLLSYFKSGRYDKKEVGKLMRNTFTSQRLTIHEKLTMEDFLKEWPFLGEFNSLKDHFYKEMKSLNEDKIVQHLTMFTPKFLRFMRSEGDKKHKGSDEIRKKIIAFDNLVEKDKCQSFVTMILCASIKMKMTASLFLYFEETTSYDEVQASNRLPADCKPIVVVLGKDILANPKCNVLIEQRLISNVFMSPAQAILACYMTYWIHKYLYPTKLSPILEFIQRGIYEMDVGPDGNTISRVERDKNDKGIWKAAPPSVNKKYLTMMREYDSFCSEWNVEKT